jgi:PKD repeat protein
MRGHFLLIGTFLLTATFAQCPMAGFEIPPSACRGQNLYLENTTTGAQTHSWDVCSGDLQLTPTTTFLVAGSTFFRARVFRMVQAQNEWWYGFAIDQPNNLLVRFDFGNSPDNVPTIVSLGNPASSFQNPLDLHFVSENNNWFALVANTSGNNLLRLNFGSDLTSAPTVTNLGSFSGILQAPGGVHAIRENGNLFAFVSNGSSSQVVSLSFGSSILNTPTASVIPVSGSVGLRGLSFIRECNRWFGVVASYNSGQLYYLHFQNGADQPPVVNQLTIPGASYSFPASVKLVNEGGEFFAFVQSAFPAHVYRIAFGESIVDLSGSFTNMGNFGISSDNSAFELIGFNSTWRGFSIDLSGAVPGSGRLFRFNFPETCSTPIRTFNTIKPTPFSYASAGSYRVTLASTDVAGNTGYKAKIISVSSAISPDIDIESQNYCSGHPVNFTSVNTSGNITSYDWNFGDFNTSVLQHPSHTYTAPGQYTVQLDVVGMNGCANTIQEEIVLYNEPVADFDLPGVSPICTNQPYPFLNTSQVDSGVNPSWEWLVNGTAVSTDFNMEASFSTPISQTVKLVAAIPGCATEMEKVIPSVSEGPVVDFSFNGHCQQAPVNFTNHSSGLITGYSWDFGDGQNSANENPASTFSLSGTYAVTLTAFGTTGCNNSRTKEITIYSKPQTDFAVALPPFSCTGSPTQFTDATPNPPDSNIASWLWDFDDGGSTSGLKNPQHTYAAPGTYQVALTAITNFGCSATMQKPALISASPSVDFGYSPPCRNVPVNFTDQTPGTNQAWLWQMESSFYSVQHPVHTFTTSGTKNVMLAVTGANGCVGTVSKQLVVPVQLVPDFTVEKNCVNQQTQFTDNTNDFADPVTAWQWTFGTLGSGTGNPAIFTFPSTGNVNVNLTVTTQTGCSYARVKSVNIGTAPVAGFTASPTVGEPPLAVAFTNTSTGATSYLWRFGDSGGSTSTESSPVFTFSELGQYTVELTAFNALSCSNKSTRTIHVVIPVIDVDVSLLELLSSQANLVPAVTLVNRSNVPIQNPVVRFDLSGRSAVDETLAITIPSNSSYRHVAGFSVPLRDGLDYICAEVLVDDTTPNNNRLCSAVEATFLPMEPYPNPVYNTQRVMVSWISGTDSSTAISLISSSGQQVFSSTAISSSGFNTLELPTGNLRAGLYILRVASGNTVKSFRLVIAE